MEIAPEQADSLLERGLISPETHASILGKMNSALVGDNNPELFDRMRSGSMTPLDVANTLGRGYDSIVGAPTRAAISAGAHGQNPVTAAAGQFGRNPDTAPDFGLVGNAVADPFVIAGAGKGLARAGTSMIEHAPQILGNEVGAIGDRPEYIQSANSMLAKFPEGEKLGDTMARGLQLTEQKGKSLPPYIDLRAKGIPIPVPNFSAEGSVIGPAGERVHHFNDPFAWYDMKHGASKRMLENANGPVQIHTGSDLIAHDDYLSRIPTGSTINFQVNTGEKTMPSTKRIIGAVNKIKADRPDVKVNVKDWGRTTSNSAPGKNWLDGPLKSYDQEMRGGIGSVPEDFGRPLTPEEEAPIDRSISLRGLKKWEPPSSAVEPEGFASKKIKQLPINKMQGKGVDWSNVEPLFPRKGYAQGGIVTGGGMDVSNLDDDTLMQLQAAGRLSPNTVAAIQGNRSPASVGDHTAIIPPLGTKQAEYKKQIEQFDVPAGQNSLTDPRGYSDQVKPGFWDTAVGAFKRQMANGFGLPSAAASEPPRTPAAAPAPASPQRVDPAQLATTSRAGAAPNSAPPIMSEDYLKGMNSAFDQEASAVKNLSGAQADAANKMAGVYDRASAEQSEFNDAMAGTYDDLKAQTQKHLSEVDDLGKKVAAAQQVDPNRYWHNMTTGQKIGNMIAIALGGFGMGYAGKQGNPVMDQINGYVDRDIQAQKENYERLRGQMGDKITLFGLARQAGLDNVAAVNAARSASLQRAEMEIKAQMARSQAPEVVARGQMLLADIGKQRMAANMDIAQRIFQMNAIRSATMGGGIQNPAFLPEEFQKKAVKMPDGNYRVANSEKGAEAVANANVHGDEVKQKLAELLRIQEEAGRSLPGSEAKALAEQKLSELYFANQKLDDMSRLSDVDLGLLKEQFADPTSLMQDRAKALLKSKYSAVESKQDLVRRQYIPGYVPMKKAAQ